jgi:hypothetical protein
MQIQQKSFGTFLVKIKAAEIVIDPQSSVKDAVVVYTDVNNSTEVNRLDESNMVIEAAGEYEVKDIFILGTKAKGGDSIVYSIVAEDINIGVISGVSNVDALPDELFEKTDILLLAAGAGQSFIPKLAEEVYQKLTPKICILFGFKDHAKGEVNPDIVDIAKLNQDITGLKTIDKVLKVTAEDLERIENTEVYYFEI